jgi:DNA-binding beta-propeller fold protein YncE
VYFDKQGNFLGSMGEKDFQLSVVYDLDVNPPKPIARQRWLHGLSVDPWDNVWVTDIGRHIVMKFSRAGRLLLTLGTPNQPGETPRNFNQPTAVVVSPSGDVYVADGYVNSRVVKFTSEGKYLMSWGKRGNGHGEFNTPHAIALDSKGNVYVAERLNDRVQVFDPDGHFLAEWPGFPGVDSIFIRPNGVTYIGTNRDWSILKLDLTGSRLQTISKNGAFSYAHGIYVDSEDSIYIADPIANNADGSASKFKVVKR